MATEILNRFVSLNFVGDTIVRGDRLLLGDTTVSNRNHSRPRKTVLPDLQAKLSGEVAELREARGEVHYTVVVQEVRNDTV